MASVYMYVSPKARDAYLTVYEQALLRALQDILAGIPPQHLAIQWDVCQEVLIYENFFEGRPEDYQQQIAAALGRLGNAVPDSVAMGYHLCYGSPADEHLIMPKDMTILVEIVNRIGEAVTRRLDFIHMPVPKDRTDDAYFQPLSGLELPADTTLHLGLIHHDDLDGDRARMAAAHKAVPTFGVAAECGWRRTDPQRVPSLLASHRQAVEYLRQEV